MILDRSCNYHDHSSTSAYRTETKEYVLVLLLETVVVFVFVFFLCTYFFRSRSPACWRSECYWKHDLIPDNNKLHISISINESLLDEEKSKGSVVNMAPLEQTPDNSNGRLLAIIFSLNAFHAVTSVFKLHWINDPQFWKQNLNKKNYECSHVRYMFWK